MKYQKVLVGILAVFLSLVFAATVSAKLSAQNIEKLREELKDQGATFTVGPNLATERDDNELCGLVPPKNWWVGAPFKDIRPRLTLPSSWNWCDQGGCTPIKNQGSCGSCWAFGTVGPLESNILIKDGMEEDLSEQYLVSCNTDYWGCTGGWWAHDYHKWKYSPPETEAGAVPESEFPYVAYEAPCGGPYSHPWKIDDWAYIGDEYGTPSVDAIKQAIMDYGPVAAAVHVGSAFQAYTGGVFNSDEPGDVNHAIVLVGWDDNQGTNGVWILRNSWSSGWGESGYMRIEYWISQVGFSANFVVYPGQIPGFRLSTQTPGPFYFCSPDSLQIQIDVESVAGFSDPVTLNYAGLPSGVDGSFDVNPITPPGSSMLTLTIEASASPGMYGIEVQGEGGGQSDTLPFTLYIDNNPPNPPSLIKPSDGEPRAGFGNIQFSWASVPGARDYHLQVDDDPSFISPEADISSISSTSYTLAGPLTQGKIFYWRVSAGNGCGEGAFSDPFSFVANPKEILLVDDDDNDPDVRSYYETALTELGHSYDVWDTGGSDNEPTLADLSCHEMVIWFTGASWGGYAGPGAEGEEALSDYIDGGGKLFITSQDYHFDKGLTPFMQNYLGVEYIVDDVGLYFTVTGQNDFTGLGPYPLICPFGICFSDIITPGSGTVSFVGNFGDIGGVYTDNTVFFVFPWEAVANNVYAGLQSSDGDELLGAIISYLTSAVLPCECDLNHDGACDMEDWLMFGEDWGRTDCFSPPPCECDINQDGKCDMQDWLLFGEDWGRTDCPVCP